jgi:peptidoglycan-N-acetylglucosamine deacetylase
LASRMLTRTKILGGAAAFAIAATTLGAGQPAMAAKQPVGCKAAPGKVLDNGSRSKKMVALTFDDGPSPYTTRILDLLKGAGAKATFFPVGQEIKGREKLLRQEFAAGMEMGNHTYTHADLGNGGQLATDEITKQTATIRSVLGFTPCLFRPPFRSMGNDLVPRVKRLGMVLVNGDVDPSDWEMPGTETIVQRVLDGAKNGSIVIMHDGGGDRSQTVAALPTILKTLKQRGYTLTTVSNLLGYKQV